MKIIVVGLGSMGSRRIRLLKSISHHDEIFGVDTNPERCHRVHKEYQVDTFSDLDVALNSVVADCVIVSTSPRSHASVINKCLNNDCHVFSEINLITEGYNDNIKLAKEKNKILFLSSTFLYRKEIQYIEHRISETNECINYTYHVGQYLPDWHPWDNLSDFFVSDKMTNGCREIFAIELPWLTKVFGEIENISVKASKMSNLKLPFNDNYFVVVEHKNGNKGMLAVDVVSRKAVRNLEIYGENIYIFWNGSPYGLKEYDYNKKKEREINLYDNVNHLDQYADFVVENAYVSELKEFFKCIEEGINPLYSFEKDINILGLIDKIEGI